MIHRAEKVSGPTNPSPTPAAAQGTQLVREQSQPVPHVLNRECDAQKAVVRGLAEYLRGRKLEINGAVLQLLAVREEWGVPAESAKYPSGGVKALGDYVYGNEERLPQVINDVTAQPGRFLVRSCEVDVELGLEVWARNPEERAQLGILLEEAFYPVDWMSGFRLWLPHYFGTTASYVLTRGGREDDENSAQRRQWRTQYTLTAHVAVLRLGRFAEADPQTRTRVESPNDPAENEAELAE